MRKPSPRPYLMNNLSEADRNYSGADRGPLTRYRWPHMRKMGSTIIIMMIGGYLPPFGRFGALEVPWTPGLSVATDVSTSFGLPSPPST